MNFEFTDLTRYYEKPPSLDELVGFKKDCRKGRRHVLVIVPSYKDSERLKIFIREFEKQKYGIFDIAVIYGKDDRFVEETGLPIIHINRKIDLGFAGAVYLGQLLAFSEGYRYFIFMDIDKFPAEDDTIKKMFDALEKSGADFASGIFEIRGEYNDKTNQYKIYHEPRVGKVKISGLWHMIRTETLKRTGLYLAPLYLGADDVEFGYRLEFGDFKKIDMGIPVFYTPSQIKDRFLDFFRNGGWDSSYSYSFIVSEINFPAAWIFGRYPLNLANKFYEFLGYLMVSRRNPEFNAYFQMARAGRFGFFSWKPWSYCADIKETPEINGTQNRLVICREKPQDARNFFFRKFTAWDNMKLVARCMLHGGEPLVYSSALDFFTAAVFDSFCVLDEHSGRFYSFTWKKSVPLFTRMALLGLAFYQTLEIFARSMLYHIAKKHRPYYAYGNEALGNYGRNPGMRAQP